MFRMTIKSWAMVFLLFGLSSAMSGEPPEEVEIPDPRTFLVIPRDTTEAEFLERLAGRTDWRTIAIQAQPADAWMDELARCPDLEILTIQDRQLTRLTSKGIGKLAACPRLRQLKVAPMGSYRLDDETLVALGRGCPELESLHVGLQGHGILTDDAVVKFALRCPKLKHLQLSVAPSLSDAALITIGKNLPLLETLILNGSASATDDGLAALANCRKLKSLTVGVKPETGDPGLRALLRNAPPLESLVLEGSRLFTDEGLAFIAATCPDLKFLVVDTAADFITDRGIVALAPLRKLEILGRVVTRPSTSQ